MSLHEVNLIQQLEKRMERYAIKELVADLRGNQELASEYDQKHKQCGREMLALLQKNKKGW